ncbi:MAG: NADH-quinone oxidoreductase subunit NuoH [Chloroflexi bacterium]|nr:NADH-quinone oxidoreductase subunit NuoH [Chloroflexota bacterium]
MELLSPLVPILIIVIKSGVAIFALVTAFAYAVWIERRVMARMQSRIGPNRAGPFGLLQPLADAVKVLLKEEIIPQDAKVPIYLLAPAVSLVPALLSFAVVPIGPEIEILGQKITLYLADLNVGVLYVFALASVGVYGIVLAGWSSGSKYSFLGALRSSAQMLSYELPLGLSVVGALMLAGTLSLVQLVEAQKNAWFILLQPLGFLIFIVSAVAEVNRAPFDLPEAETELVAGYHTEYTSIKWAFFYMAEYINMIVVSSIAVTLFFGGWQGPFFPPAVWYFLKVAAFIFLFIWLRATLPRLRYDRLMQFGWKILLPLSLVNIIATAAIMVWQG